MGCPQENLTWSTCTKLPVQSLFTAGKFKEFEVLAVKNDSARVNAQKPEPKAEHKILAVILDLPKTLSGFDWHTVSQYNHASFSPKIFLIVESTRQYVYIYSVNSINAKKFNKL
jgi:hypothetical protein